MHESVKGYKAGYSDGVKDTEQRIIELLDDSYLSDKGKQHLIELIKGEK